MAQQNTAKNALRRLHVTLVRKLDPGIVHDLFSKGLLTDNEKERVEAGRTNSEKNGTLMSALEMREPEKVLKVLVAILEGEEGVDKAANAHILKKIAEGRHEQYLHTVD